MKIKYIVETLAIATIFASSLNLAHAAPISLQGGTVTASYNGEASGMRGADSAYEPGPVSHVTSVSGADMEYISSDFQFIFDLSTDGLLTVFSNADAVETTPGSFTAIFDFGTTLASAITSFTALDLTGVSGTPTFTVLNSHAVALSYSNLAFRDAFGSFTAQIGTDAVAAVPEPGTLGLLLAGLGAFALRRLPTRKRTA